MPTNSTLYVIDPAVKRPELEAYNWISNNTSLRTSYHLPALFGFDSIETADTKPSGIMILGSASSVLERLPWQTSLRGWLKPHLTQGTPILGVCFGHQLIAEMNGSNIRYTKPDQSKRYGFYPVELKPNRLWQNQALSGELAFSHCEIVDAAPDGFDTLCSTADVAIEALAHRTLPIWTFQAHPEASCRFLRNAGYALTEQDTKLAFGRSLVRRFLHYVEVHRA